VRASGSGALVGTTDAPKIEGDLRLVETDVYLGDAVPSGSSVQAIELTEAQIRELEETLGYPVRREDDAPPGALFRALSLELSVAASRDTWVRQRANPELEIQLTGDVDVSKEPGDSLRLDGRVEAVPRRSWVEQFGRRFRIEEGVVDFRGTVPRTRIDVRAAYEVPTTRDDQPEATITLDLEGTPQDLSLTAGSDPPMENADILSYLATGRPAASSLDVQGEGGEGGLGTVGSEFALGQVAGLVEGLAAEGVGLDVVDIRTDGLRGATVVAGRYVTPELYVGFKQPVGRDGDASEPGTSFDQTEVEVELQALRWLLLNMEASNSALRLLLRFRRAY
jgi:translocation and assembly module TamB